MSDANIQRVNLLGVGVSLVSMQQTLDALSGWIEERASTYIVVSPVYTIMRCQHNSMLRQIVNQAGLVTPDGMPLVLLSRWMGYSNVERVYGPDLMLKFSAIAAERGYKQYYYGGNQSVPQQLADNLTEEFPGLQVVGTHSPPFRELTSEEDDAIVAAINAANPDVVWVGLGSPRQDYWMAHHRERLNAPLLIGVGAAFDIHTGRVPQAPAWMQRNTLEWLFRLYTEPRRLWRRYLIFNPLFVIYMFLQVSGLRRLPLN